MSTTQTPERITITSIDREAFDFEEVRDGEGLGMAVVGFTREFDHECYDDQRRGLAWEKEVIDPAIEEVLPQIRDLIVAAVEQRLPWTWEPER